MIAEIRGIVFLLGDNVDTDQIYPSRFIELTEEREMATHALEGISPNLVSRLTTCGILVAGRNFGCGSSREHAPRSLKAAGIKLIMARSFARIFYRNSINLGLPAIQLPPEIVIDQGDELVVYPAEGKLINLSKKAEYSCTRFSGLVAEILEAGGLVEYYRRRT